MKLLNVLKNKLLKEELIEYHGFKITNPGYQFDQEEKKELFDTLKVAIDALKDRGFRDLLSGPIKVIEEPKGELAALYKQKSKEHGGYGIGTLIYNIDAKNANPHTVVHELGHKLWYEQFSPKQKETWKKYWTKRIADRGRKAFMTTYGQKNEREDFAEVFAFYCLGNKIDSYYDKGSKRLNKDVSIRKELVETFKKIVYSSSEELENEGFWDMKRTGTKKSSADDESKSTSN